jgi:5'-3' exoribonuclease 2
MGIPSYFTKVVKAYRHILKDMKYLSHVNNLYMDCNSLIYDAVKNNPTYDKGNTREYEKELIKMVCNKIDFYVDLLKPTTRVFIAFDGVAPVAKLSQQRDRRYKSWYTAQIQRDIEGAAYKEAWNTSAITPGTNFMRQLNDEVSIYFSKKSGASYVPGMTTGDAKTLEYIVSSSSESGEGEHKIFDYMRKYPEYHNSPDTTTLVYGLDADLIMLTLNHLHITKNLYLFRETPEFIKSVDSTLDANKDYLLDIPELADSIIKYINNVELDGEESMGVGDTRGNTGARDLNKLKCKRDNEINRITDYIFMCFLLGNDFMPHFPALNIRTVGIDILLNVYRETLGKTDKYLTEGNKIVWKNFHEFIENIAKQEDTLLMDEHKKRDKFAKRLGDGGGWGGFGRAGGGGGHSNNHSNHSNHTNMRDNRSERNAFNRDINKNQNNSQFFAKNDKKVLYDTEEVLGEGADIQKMDDLLMLPMKERSIEKYINPFAKDWEYRYYKALFDIEVTDDRRRQICINYLEGLEWTFHYYMEGCIDWRWCYNYHYAPLCKDLVKYIPRMDTQFLKRKEKQTIEDLVQLCYVLPRQNLNLLPVEVNIVLMQRLGHLYGDDYEFKWAYCRYFWESHAELPRLHIETLEEIVHEAKNKTTFATSKPIPIPIPIPKSPIFEKKLSPITMEIKSLKI